MNGRDGVLASKPQGSSGTASQTSESDLTTGRPEVEPGEMCHQITVGRPFMRVSDYEEISTDKKPGSCYNSCSCMDPRH